MIMTLITLIGIYNFVENLEKQKTYKIVKLFSDKNRGYAIAYKL